MVFEFNVDDIPPKKHGEKSMWDQPVEASRIISLRKQAIRSIKINSEEDKIRGYIQLELYLYVPKSQIERVGDLDNFINGICDGLQSAHYNTKKFHSDFLLDQNQDTILKFL